MQHRLFRDPGLSYVFAAGYGLAGLSYFKDPAIAQRTVVGEAFAPYDAIWNGLYILAAVLIVIRLLVGGRHWEGTGLVVLVGGLVINAAAALSVQGLTDIRSYIPFVFAGGCALRLRFVAAGG